MQNRSCFPLPYFLWAHYRLLRRAFKKTITLCITLNNKYFVAIANHLAGEIPDFRPNRDNISTRRQKQVVVRRLKQVMKSEFATNSFYEYFAKFRHCLRYFFGAATNTPFAVESHGKRRRCGTECNRGFGYCFSLYFLTILPILVCFQTLLQSFETIFAYHIHLFCAGWDHIFGWICPKR